MADADGIADRPSRRRFLRQALGRDRTVTLSCAQLYIRYVDALGIGRPESFVESARREIGSAAEVILTDRGWLAREDFARALEDVLRPTARPPMGRRASRRHAP